MIKIPNKKLPVKPVKFRFTWNGIKIIGTVNIVGYDRPTDYVLAYDGRAHVVFNASIHGTEREVIYVPNTRHVLIEIVEE